MGPFLKGTSFKTDDSRQLCFHVVVLDGFIFAGDVFQDNAPKTVVGQARTGRSEAAGPDDPN